MSVGRFFRTVRHLSVEQVAFSVIRRGRHEAWRRSPQARERMADAALALPASDMARPSLAPIADVVATLQSAIHTDSIEAIRAGDLTLLGETFHVDGWARFDWRVDLGEGNSPLRRLTLAYLGWAVPLLGTGKTDDLEQVAAAVESLDAVSWAKAGVFRDLWNPYAASHRLINLVAGLHRHAGAGSSLASPAAERLHRHARFCAAFVASDPERDLQANHLLKNWTALAVFAASTESPARVFLGLPRRIARSLDQLVLEDGGHAERSPMYHALAVADLDLIRASHAAPCMSGHLDDIAARLRHALAIVTHPDGDIALFNDSWLGGAPRPSTEPAPEGASALPDTGYIRLGTAGEAVIFDCGPCGIDLQPGHAHADFLSFELSLAAMRFVVDPGTPTYTAGALRDRSRSAASHNGPHVDGHEPIEFWRSFRIGRRANSGGLHDETLSQAPLWCAGWHDGYSGHGIEPRRWIGLWPGQGLLVVDLWAGAAAPGGAKTLFLIPDDWKAGAADGTLVFDGPARVRAEALAGHLEVSRTVWWPRYGTEKPATGLKLHPENADPGALAALLFTWGTRAPVNPTMLAALVRGLTDARRTPPRGYQA